MKFSLTWLRDYLDTAATVEEISAALNAIGLEVEGIEDPAAKLAGFRVAKVLTAEQHPNADKLRVLTVDTGEGAPLQVVCGAPNARAGLVGVLGLFIFLGGLLYLYAPLAGVTVHGESANEVLNVRALSNELAHVSVRFAPVLAR